MRRRALAEAVRLTGGRPAVQSRGAVALGEAQLSTIPLCVRTAGCPPSASTSSASTSPGRTPLSLGHARPASGLPSRGLACPPHGGVTGDKSRAVATTPTTAPSPDALDPAAEAAYHAAADDTLHVLLDGLEAWVDDTPDLGDVDVEYSSGVLTLAMGPGKGTYVLNKQAPNRQLWLSSPVSGPIRYDFTGGKWVYARDGHCLLDKLREELAVLAGVPGPAI